MSQDKIQKARELVLNYIATHTLSDKLNRAVNEVCRSRPTDPWLFLSDIITEWTKDVPIIDRLVAKQGIDCYGKLSLQLQLFGRVGSTRPPRFIGQQNVFIIDSNTNDNDDDSKSNKANSDSMIKKITEFLSPALRSIRIDQQNQIDQELSKLYADGLQEESTKLNIIPTISSLIAESASKHLRTPLYKYLGNKRQSQLNEDDTKLQCVLPNVMTQLTKSVSNRLPSVCVMIKTHLRPMQRIQSMREIAQQLLLDIDQSKGRHAVFDEETGAILIEDTDCINTEELLQLVNGAITNALKGTEDVCLCLSFTSNPSVITYTEQKTYQIKENIYGNVEDALTHDVMQYFEGLLDKHKEIEYLEDPLHETDKDGYAVLKEKVKAMIIGNGLYSSMIGSIQNGITSGLSSGAAVSTKEIFIISKALNISNMIGQVSDGEVMLMVCDNVSDNAISTYAVDLSVACNAQIIKLSLPNSGKSKDKYNRWLMIAEDLSNDSEYAQTDNIATENANTADKNTNVDG
eukprot:45237_1